MSNSRKRSDNWTSEDKMLLQELVKERVSIIENKNTDTNTNVRKVAAWADLLASFNAMRNGAERTAAQLRVQWGSQKAAEKKKLAAERKTRQATGGGPPPRESPTDHRSMSAWLPQEFVTDTNEFDSDFINPTIQVSTLTTPAPQAPIPPPQAPTPPPQAPTPDPQSPTPARASPVDQAEPARQAEAASGPRRRKRKTLRPSENPASDIAAMEIKCREELHQFQMGTEKIRRENEERKKKILDLKEQLLLTKIEYFKKKMEI